MGLFTSLALTAATAGLQIGQGVSANNEAKYNASLSEQKAQQIDIQKGLEGYQADRSINKMRGTIISRTAANGLDMSGSPMASMIDTLTQMELDKSIGQYNLEVEKRNALSTADQYRRQGQSALMAGYANAFSSILQGSFLASQRYGTPSIPKQTSRSAMIRGTNGAVTRVPTRPYQF